MVVVQCFPHRPAVIKFHGTVEVTLLPSLLQILSEKGSTLQSVNSRTKFASKSKVISRGFEWDFPFIFFSSFTILLQGILLDKAENINKKEKYRVKDILEHF